jgi:hypothetical protein
MKLPREMILNLTARSNTQEREVQEKPKISENMLRSTKIQIRHCSEDNPDIVRSQHDERGGH